MNCWNCKYQQLGGMTFLGFCKYFDKLGKEKEHIPSNVVDKGCRFFEMKDESRR
jgi:hypothetical protein